MIGKNPDWNVPALFPFATPFRKMLMSPLTMLPLASWNSPSWNQNSVFGMWCSPNGISRRLINPYANIIPAFPYLFPVASERACENLKIAYPTHGNTIAYAIPNTKIPRIHRTGISLLPEKNPSTDGNSVPLNLL